MMLWKIFFLLLVALGNAVFARDLVTYTVFANDDKRCKSVMYGDRSKDRPELKVFWNGRCSNGFIQGNGSMKIIYPAGGEMVTTVNFINGMEQGPGLAETTFPDGSKIIFSGTFKDGLYAKGTKTVASQKKSFKEVYEGPFLNSEKSGKGILYYKNGDDEYKYSGDFLDNKFNGIGTIFYKDGSWTGPFTNGKLNGTGRYASINGQYGSMTFANGEKIAEEADAPAPINVEKLREILLPPRITPFNCTTFGSNTSCQ